MLFCLKVCSSEPEIEIHFRYYCEESIELAVETDRFQRLVRTSETTFDRNATALVVLLWLAKSCLLDSSPYLCLCLKLYLTIGVSIASCEKSFSKLKRTKPYLQKLDFEYVIAVFAST